MGTSNDVKKKLPGLAFRVDGWGVGGKTRNGTFIGTITLRCEYKDQVLFDEARRVLDGFKVGVLSTEMTDALCAELDVTVAEKAAVETELVRLNAALEAEQAEVARLRALFATLEHELGE